MKVELMRRGVPEKGCDSPGDIWVIRAACEMGSLYDSDDAGAKCMKLSASKTLTYVSSLQKEQYSQDSETHCNSDATLLAFLHIEVPEHRPR
jgi:hypothetical protein